MNSVSSRFFLGFLPNENSLLKVNRRFKKYERSEFALIHKLSETSSSWVVKCNEKLYRTKKLCIKLPAYK